MNDLHGPVPVADKAALKMGYDLIAKGETAAGMKIMAKVFLGWTHQDTKEPK